MRKPKVLIWDIETSYLKAAIWQPGQQYIQHDRLLPEAKEYTILSFGAKWLGEKEVMYESTEGRRNPRDDKKVVKALWQLRDEADVEITQNGKRFDIPKTRGRFSKHNLGEPSPSKQIDTYQMGVKFGLPSASLAYMTAFFCPHLAKEKHNTFPGNSLWDECLAGNPKAWAAMEKYNKQDVRGTEGVFNAMAPYVDTKVDFSVYEDSTDWVCSCGSSEWRFNGHFYSSSGKFRRFKCKSCKKNRTESGAKNNLLSKEKRASLKGKS